MKCLNCGGEDFEKAEHDGQFTTAFAYSSSFDFVRREKTVIVPRYFHACLKCGLVHQMLDLDVRRDEMKKLINYALEDQLSRPVKDYSDFLIGRISIGEVSEMTNIPRPLFDELVKELLQGHSGYDGFHRLSDSKEMRVIPVLEKSEGELWIIGKKA